jgi:hypothetical protein
VLGKYNIGDESFFKSCVVGFDVAGSYREGEIVDLWAFKSITVPAKVILGYIRI